MTRTRGNGSHHTASGDQPTPVAVQEEITPEKARQFAVEIVILATLFGWFVAVVANLFLGLPSGLINNTILAFVLIGLLFVKRLGILVCPESEMLPVAIFVFLWSLAAIMFPIIRTNAVPAWMLGRGPTMSMIAASTLTFGSIFNILRVPAYTRRYGRAVLRDTLLDLVFLAPILFF